MVTDARPIDYAASLKPFPRGNISDYRVSPATQFPFMPDEADAMNPLFITNNDPGGNERPSNALRLSMNSVQREEIRLRGFLMGDGVQCALTKQTTPEGFYKIERRIKPVARKGEVAT